MIKTEFKTINGKVILEISFGCNYFLMLIGEKQDGQNFLVTIKEHDSFRDSYLSFPCECELKSINESPREYILEEDFIEHDLLKIGIDVYLSKCGNISEKEYAQFLKIHEKIVSRFDALDQLICYLKSRDSTFEKSYNVDAGSGEYFNYEEDYISSGSASYRENRFSSKHISIDNITSNTLILNELDNIKNNKKEKLLLKKQQEVQELFEEKEKKIKMEKHERAEYERLKAKFEK